MRYFVTGASGHLGSHVVRLLLDRNAEVTVLLRESSDPWRLNGILDRVRIIYGDFAAIAHCGEAIVLARPEIVIHAAWQGVSAARWQDPEQILTNVPATLELVRISAVAGARCWVGMGSQAEYGSSGLLSEASPTSPQTLYGAAKLAASRLAEQLCATYAMRFLWLRVFATYGPMDDDSHLIPFVIGELLAGRSPALTPGEQRWDYLYVVDAAEALCRAAEDETVHGIMNLGSGEAVSVRAIAERVRDRIAPSMPLRFGAIPYAPQQIMHLQADISKLRSILNWRPFTSLDDGLTKTVEWYDSVRRSVA